MIERQAPWQDPTATADLIPALRSAPRIPLPEILDGSRVRLNQPAAYVQFVAAPDLEPLLGPACSSGTAPIYVGSSDLLGPRLRRHRRSIAGISALDEDQLFLAIVPCCSHGAALWVEAELTLLLTPPLQGTGWGARQPGKTRRGRCSTVDAVLPREWARAASPVEHAQALLHLAANLARMNPSGPRWPPLTPERADRHKPAGRLVVPGSRFRPPDRDFRG